MDDVVEAILQVLQRRQLIRGMKIVYELPFPAFHSPYSNGMDHLTEGKVESQAGR